ncbi:unnamed protein product, partial [Ixodes hexagonus]
LNLWRGCFDHAVFAECKRNVEENIKQLRADGALLDEDVYCRNASHAYLCALKAGEKCSAEIARKAVESYINATLDMSHCPRPTGYPCDDRLFYLCHWNALEFVRPNNSLDADLLAEGCKRAKSVSTCTRNLVIEQCPEQDKKLLRALQHAFSPIPDSICDARFPASINAWNQCFDSDTMQDCLTDVEELLGNLTADPNFEPRTHDCRRQEEELKCELLAVESCLSSASLARKAVLNFKLNLFGLHHCPRPKLDGGSGDSGFSVTPKVFVTLAAPLVALLLVKQTLFRQLI